MANVAFLGLGVMGYPMAGHLAKKGGHTVTVYNRTAEKAEKWAKEFGGQACADAARGRRKAKKSFSPASAMTTICAPSCSARTARSPA